MIYTSQIPFGQFLINQIFQAEIFKKNAAPSHHSFQSLWKHQQGEQIKPFTVREAPESYLAVNLIVATRLDHFCLSRRFCKRKINITHKSAMCAK